MQAIIFYADSISGPVVGREVLLGCLLSVFGWSSGTYRSTMWEMSHHGGIGECCLVDCGGGVRPRVL